MNNAAYLHEEVAKWVKSLLPMLTDRHSSCNSGEADVFGTDQKNNSNTMKVEVTSVGGG